MLHLAEQLRPKEFIIIKLNAEEIWEKVRKEGALTPEVESRLAKERAEGIEFLLGDLENRDYIQMKFIIDYMTDDQLSQMVNQLSTIRLSGLISYLTPAQTERVLSSIESEKKRHLIDQLLKDQDVE